MKLFCIFAGSVLAKNAEKVAAEEEALQMMVDNLLNLAENGTISNSYADNAILAMTAESTDGFRIQSGRISFSSLSFAIAEVKRVNLEAMISVMVGKENMPATDFWTPEDRDTAQVTNSFQKYGCYCDPVDEIDALCKNLWDAYKCLPIDDEECASTASYKWKVGAKGGELKCLDREGTCARAVCETDRDFATELAEVAHIWDAKYHMDSGFDREAQCTGESESFQKMKPTSSPKQIGEESSSDTSVGDSVKCCGTGTFRHSFKTNRLQCCSDGTTKAFGACGI
ncbi:Oidioi.mRNA.OKI2018_I69.chr2.g5266.t1.cds [Oikopleura dioica]|uniref:Oidioi.mRNA.OKI2018_I69.chr2.g5266.t1.cds n=1 Tax=Oikopleura dioica TaxID=34765 RepID=A0ABN7T6E8_OIKDI|nr:Oidioi.mRNA.OKI2018_I69.chr2.g5266.t1.cds [Oikopleura dioica]